jgi:hypothetical protein
MDAQSTTLLLISARVRCQSLTHLITSKAESSFVFDQTAIRTMFLVKSPCAWNDLSVSSFGNGNDVEAVAFEERAEFSVHRVVPFASFICIHLEYVLEGGCVSIGLMHTHLESQRVHVVNLVGKVDKCSLREDLQSISQ